MTTDKNRRLAEEIRAEGARTQMANDDITGSTNELLDISRRVLAHLGQDTSTPNLAEQITTAHRLLAEADTELVPHAAGGTSPQRSEILQARDHIALAKAALRRATR